ncbi:LysR family transcriptional regulator [Streptococcus respiraculi]|uniref:LysR family transcriptional regulator n=1 Tax=Streptococcus respiraculi TaxID=2021971 RepID=UPI000E7424F0|nr:LysR family transcriptional regulator [Streptococcus respiraculi]
MNLQHLRYFLTLADLEHYTDAAKSLHITQPTLSHAIAMLEEELQVPLLTKQGRNVILTEQGKEFYTTVQSSLAILDSGVQNLQRRYTNKPNIHLTLLRVLGRKAVPQLVRKFIEAYPETDAIFDFHNDSGMSLDMIEGLIHDKYDLAFCSKLDEYPTISYIPIFSQDLVLIVPKQHPLSAQETVTLEDTLIFPQVWFSKRSGVRPVIEQLYQPFEDKPQIAFEVSEDETVAGLVAQGFGLAIIPKFDFLSSIEDIEVIEMDALKDARIYYAAYRKDKLLSTDLKNFIDFITTSSMELGDIV